MAPPAEGLRHRHAAFCSPVTAVRCHATCSSSSGACLALAVLDVQQPGCPTAARPPPPALPPPLPGTMTRRSTSPCSSPSSGWRRTMTVP